MSETEKKLEVQESKKPSIADRFFDGPGRYLFPCYTEYRNVSRNHILELKDPRGTKFRLIATDLAANLASIGSIAVPIVGGLHSGDLSLFAGELATLPLANFIKGFNKRIGDRTRIELLKHVVK